jgi:hypothetical protein
VAFVLAISLSACSGSRTPDAYEKDRGLATGLVVAALNRPPSTGGPPGKVILPDPKLIRCSTSSCPSVLPDGKDPRVVYPWQVSLDYNNGSVIGLTALYDDPISVDDVRTVVNERYGKFAFDSNGRTPVSLWRVEPEKLAISLSTNEYGMVQLIYLSFDAKHPTSEKATERFLDRLAKDGKR